MLTTVYTLTYTIDYAFIITSAYTEEPTRLEGGTQFATSRKRIYIHRQTN